MKAFAVAQHVSSESHNTLSSLSLLSRKRARLSPAVSDPDLEGSWPLKRHVTEFYASDLNWACTTNTHDPETRPVPSSSAFADFTGAANPLPIPCYPLPSLLNASPPPGNDQQQPQRPGSASEHSMEEEVMVSGSLACAAFYEGDHCLCLESIPQITPEKGAELCKLIEQLYLILFLALFLSLLLAAYLYHVLLQLRAWEALPLLHLKVPKKKTLGAAHCLLLCLTASERVIADVNRHAMCSNGWHKGAN
eukprot:scaffold126476_cov19-Tisochrysis_lutea.AAC.2